MIVRLSYLKALSLPLLPKKVNVFVLDLGFCLFCMVLFGGGQPTAVHFYCTVVGKCKYNLFYFCFLKIWFSLWHKTCSRFVTIPTCWQSIHILKKTLQELQPVFINDLERRTVNPLNTSSYFFSPKFHNTLFLQCIWFTVLSIDQLLITQLLESHPWICV